MKKLIALASIAALAACSQKAEEAPVAADTVAAVETPAMGTAPGTYDVFAADGSPAGKTTINPDGTYEETDKDGKASKGTFAVKDGKDCFDEEGDVADVCWAVTAPGADGSFTATSADGKTVLTVKPSAAPATAPAPAAT